NLFPCHNFKLVFTKGACSNKRRSDAAAGMRIVMGSIKRDQYSIPIDDTLDTGYGHGEATSQQAELL
ncbi:hypothetical protein EDD85DRAFT_736957, partial [Armillaria nabsnona]